MKIVAKAYAKLNVVLNVTKKREDGFHNIESVFQSVSLFDTLEFSKKESGIDFSCTEAALTRNNLCIKAAEYFFYTSKCRGGANIALTKNIPVVAGLGGGSTDAAATLLALNKLYNNPLPLSVLSRIAADLGADVPFCLIGGTAKLEGKGEKLTNIKELPTCSIVIVKNGSKPSTAALYGMLDNAQAYPHPNIYKALAAIESGNIKDIASSLGNSFSAVSKDCEDIKADLIDLGALGAELSGSGPAVFGIFAKSKGRAAARKLKEKYPFVYLCNPTSDGVILSVTE